MTAQAHVIGKQVLEFELEPGLDTYMLPRELEEIFRTEVVPAMEVFFDRCLPTDAVLRLSRVELDIGWLAREQLDGSFARRVCEALEARLAEHLAGTATSPGAGAVEHLTRDEHTLALWHHVLLHGYLPWWAPRDGVATLEASVLAVLASRGSLPPATARLLRQQPVALPRLVLQGSEVLLQRVWSLAAADLAAEALPIVTALLRLLETAPMPGSRTDTLRRHLWQAALEEALRSSTMVPRTRLRGLLRVAMERSAREMSIGYPTLLAQFHACLRAAATYVPSPALSAQLREHLRTTLPPESTLAEGGAPDAATFRPHIPESPDLEIPGKHENDPPAGKQHAHRDPGVTRPSPSGRHEPGISSPGSRSGDQRSDGESPAVERRDEPSGGVPPEPTARSATVPADRRQPDASVHAGDSEDHTADGTSPHREKLPGANPPHRQTASSPAGDPRSRHVGDRPTTTPDKAEALFVDAAGIVLLHPFINAHFEKLDLLTDAGFRDDDARQRAVHQLRFLATGEEAAPETLLVLEKILCGLTPEQPIVRWLALEQRARDEADRLLRAVIRHWGALKNTSPDGLRETFLRREGRLERRDEGWRLQVQARSYDLLLDRLPWPRSVVRLPWMSGLLWVEWG